MKHLIKFLAVFLISASLEAQFYYGGIQNGNQQSGVPAARGNRFADAQDVTELGGVGVPVSIGDYIIDTKYAGGQDIQIREAWGLDFTLGPGKKIFIRGGQYEDVWIDMPNVIGSAVDPIIVTNYLGQVEIRDALSIQGGQHLKFTGKYEAGVSGDPSYRGHDNGYAYSSGTYGFYLNNQWTNISTNMFRIQGSSTISPATNIEIEYFEIGNGGFSGINAKDDNTNFPAVIMELHIHDNYIHDTDGEGLYLGFNTTNSSQHRLQATVENNRIIRTGAEGIQIGNGYNCIVRNNVIHAANNWKNPFQQYQDNNIQLVTRGGTNIVEKNICLFGGEKWINYYNVEVEAGGQDIFRDNLFDGSQNFGIFIGSDPAATVDITFERNIFVNRQNDFQEVYTAALVPEWVRSFDSNQTKYFTDNVISDDGATFVNVPAGDIETGTTRAVSTMPDLDFLANTFIDDVNWTSYEFWSATIGEKPGFFASGTNKGDDNVFSLDDHVVYHDAAGPSIYRSLTNNNFGNQPNRVDDANWDYLEFQGNGIPNDDYRLEANNPFNAAGWGLLDNPTPTTDQFEFVQGSRTMLFASLAAQGQNNGYGQVIDYRYKVMDVLPPDTLYQFVLMGQSQAGGADANPALTTSTVADVYTLTDGPMDADVVSGSLVLATEGDDNDNNGSSLNVETYMTSMMQQLNAWNNTSTDHYLGTVHYRNGTTLQALNDGGGSEAFGHDDQVAALTRGKALADANGWYWQPIGMLSHGGTGINPYQTAVAQYATEFKAAVDAIQPSTNKIIIADQQREGAGDPQYGIQIYDHALTDADFHVTIPRDEVVDYFSAIHLSNHGSRHNAMYFAQAARQLLWSGSYTNFLVNGTATTWDGTKLIIPTTGADGAIVGTGDYNIEVYNVTDAGVIAGTWAVNGTDLEFTPTSAPTGVKDIEIRTARGTGTLRDSRGNTGVIFNDGGASPYTLYNVPLRQDYSVNLNFGTDTTAPVLTLATDTETGETTGSGTVTTDEDNGTLYYVATENASENLATVKAGSSQAVSTTGVQNVTVSGLTASTTYYIHYAHTDAAGNDSNVLSGDGFTTDAPPISTDLFTSVWTSLGGQAIGTAPVTVTYTNEVRNDESWANSSGTITLPTGRYLATYQVGFIAGGQNNRANIVVKARLDGTDIAGSFGSGYKRDTNNDAAWALGSCIVNVTGATGDFDVQMFRDTDSNINTTDATPTYISIIALDASTALGYYQPTAAPEAQTFGDMTLGTTLLETDAGVISRTGNDVTVAANGNYLIVGGAHYAQATNRTSRFIRALRDGSLIAGSQGYGMQRNSGNEYGSPNTFSIIETDGTDDVIKFQSRRPDVGVTGGSTLQSASSGFWILELPSGVEWYSSSDAIMAQGVAGSTVDINFNRTVDKANANIVTSGTTNSVTLAEGSYFVSSGIMVDRTDPNGTRLTREANFKLDGVNQIYAFNGNYNRGDQGSEDVFDNTFNPRGYISATAGQVLTLTIDEDRDAAWNDGGGSPQTLNEAVGFYAMKLYQPTGGSAPTDITLSANSIDENATGLVGNLTDDGSPSGAYTITGGADQASFSIVNTDELHVSSPFDYETQTTAQVEVTSTNATGSFAETFTINIGDVVEGGFSQKILVDIAASSGTRSYQSQTIQAVGRGVNTNNLVRVDGVASPFDISWLNVGNNAFGSSGVNAAGDEFDASAWQNYVWANSGLDIEVVISDFTPGQTVQLQVSASRAATGRGVQVTAIGATTVVKEFDAANNTSYTSVDSPTQAGAVHIDIDADGSGEIKLEVRNATGFTFGYLGNLKILYN